MRDDLDKAEDRLEWANNALKSDWTRWQKVMRTDLRSAFVDTAERNVSYYEKVRCLLSPKYFFLINIHFFGIFFYKLVVAIL